MLTWIQEHPDLLWALGIASAILFVASLLAIPPLVARIPVDYFAHDQRPRSRWGGLHPVLRIVALVSSTLLGLVFLAAGVAMLVLPGQGLLTMFVGFLMLEYPGKYRLERALVRQRLIARPLNWLRRRAGREPFRFE